MIDDAKDAASIATNDITSMTQSEDGKLWISTYWAGVEQLDRHGQVPAQGREGEPREGAETQRGASALLHQYHPRAPHAAHAHPRTARRYLSFVGYLEGCEA